MAFLLPEIHRHALALIESFRLICHYLQLAIGKLR